MGHSLGRRLRVLLSASHIGLSTCNWSQAPLAISSLSPRALASLKGPAAPTITTPARRWSPPAAPHSASPPAAAIRSFCGPARSSSRSREGLPGLRRENTRTAPVEAPDGVLAACYATSARLARAGPAGTAARLPPIHPAGFGLARIVPDTCALPPFCPRWLALGIQACTRAQTRLGGRDEQASAPCYSAGSLLCEADARSFCGPARRCWRRRRVRCGRRAPAARRCGDGRGSWPLQARQGARGKRGDCQRRNPPGAPKARQGARSAARQGG